MPAKKTEDQLNYALMVIGWLIRQHANLQITDEQFTVLIKHAYGDHLQSFIDASTEENADNAALYVNRIIRNIEEIE